MLARAFQDDPAWALGASRRRPALGAAAVALPHELRGHRGPGLDDARRGRRLRALASAGPPEIHVGAMLRALVATPLRVREATSRFLAYGRAVEACVPRRPRAALVPRRDRRRPGRRRAGIGSALMQPGLEASAATASRAPSSRTTRRTSPSTRPTASRSSRGRHRREDGREGLDDAEPRATRTGRLRRSPYAARSQALRVEADRPRAAHEGTRVGGRAYSRATTWASSITGLRRWRRADPDPALRDHRAGQSSKR